MRNLWVSMSSGLIGAAAAVATIVVWNWVDRADTSQARAATDAQEPPGDKARTKLVVRQVGESRLIELERQVRELKEQRHLSEGETDGAAEAANLEEQQLKLQEMLTTLDRRHEEEPVDREWAMEAELNLSSGLSVMGKEFAFLVDSAECKTTSCRASISWPDYGAARRTGAELAERHFPDLNCRQTISYPKPEDPDRPYSARLYLDCGGLEGRSLTLAE